MTLDQWIALSPRQRNRRRSQWPPDRGYWIDLIDEAHQRFKREFGNHPLVNYVSFQLRLSEMQEPVISVTTALRSPQILEELPDRYCTFRVVQEANGRRKRRYLDFWTLVLGKLLRWPKSKVRQWARKHHNVINGIGSFADHRTPLDYIPEALIVGTLGRRLPADAQLNVERRLARALERWDPATPLPIYSPLQSNYDWAAARARIKKILSPFLSRR